MAALGDLNGKTKKRHGKWLVVMVEPSLNNPRFSDMIMRHRDLTNKNWIQWGCFVGICTYIYIKLYIYMGISGS